MNDGYSDYFTSLLGKTTIQITKIVFFFLSMHTVQLKISYHQFFFLWLHQKRNENGNKFNDEKKASKTKQECKQQAQLQWIPGI